jgi:SAM-dependent methyltransferase
VTPEAVDPGGPGIVLNLAGEGEVEEAIDINSLVFPLRRPEQWARPGRFIQADITALPVRSAVALEVVGRKLPMMNDDDRSAVVREAARVLVPGGVLRLHSSNGGGALWLPFLEAEGLASGTIDGIYATGAKPR